MLSNITALANVAQQAIYTVPAGKVYEIDAFRVSVSALSIVRLRLRASPEAILTTEFDIPLSAPIAFNSVAPILL